MKKLICFLLILAFVFPTYAEEVFNDNSISIKIEERKIEKTVYHIAWINLTDPKQFKTAVSEDNGNIKATVLDIANSNNALLAINGDYFTNRSTGLIIRNYDEIRKRPNNKYDLLIIDENADFHIIENSNPKELKAFVKGEHKMMHVFSFGPALIKDGKSMAISTKYDFAPQDSTAPRTAIGQIAPLQYVLVVADGRQKGYSRGASHKMIRNLMMDLGCETAYNLDGGGTSTMVYNGEILNKPPKGELREISDIIYFVSLNEKAD